MPVRMVSDQGEGGDERVPAAIARGLDGFGQLAAVLGSEDSSQTPGGAPEHLAMLAGANSQRHAIRIGGF